jgi:LPS export ABC transporter protein LptC
MTNGRFHRKTKQTGITTTFMVVVVLFLFPASCSNESKEVVEVAFDPEHTYIMRTTDVSSLISDSGVTRYRLNTKEMIMYDKAKEPYWYFPQGVYIERFDTLFKVEASVKADTTYYWDKKGLAKLIGHVKIENLRGEQLETELLYWDRNKKQIYSDVYVRIDRQGKILTSIGFESDEGMADYKLYHPQGAFLVSESPPVTE